MADQSYEAAVAAKLEHIAQARQLHRVVRASSDRLHCGCGIEDAPDMIRIHLQVLESDWRLPAGVRPK